MGHAADAGQGKAQVAMDVVVQGLQRRDVDQTHAGRTLFATLSRRRRLVLQSRRGGGQFAKELVNPPQERGQGLARAGWGQDQGMLTPLDGRPPLGLRGCRLTKAFLKRPARVRFVENIFRLLSPLL